MSHEGFDVGPGVPERELVADALRELAVAVERGQVSAIVVGYRLESDGVGIGIVHASHDQRLSVEVFEDLIEMAGDVAVAGEGATWGVGHV